jgi:serine/threonine protein kinase
VTEFLSRGNLHQLLKSGFRLVSANPALRFKMVHDIVKGMLYLHSYKPTPILHRDLTTTNLLVSETLTVKVADFGLSRPASPDEQLTAGVLMCVRVLM